MIIAQPGSNTITALAQGTPVSGSVEDGTPATAGFATTDDGTADQDDHEGADTPGGSSLIPQKDRLTFVGYLLLFLTVIVTIIVIRFQGSENILKELVEKLLQTGKTPKISRESQIFITRTGNGVNTAESPDQPIKVGIKGPLNISKGEFVTYELTTEPASDVIPTWSFADPTSGKLTQNGKKVEVVARQAGIITLQALLENVETPVTFDITVKETEVEIADTSLLPNPTAGWATSVITVLVVGLAFGLGVLANEVAAVLAVFGTILGYAFGKTNSS